ncbi:MAG: hypothetical protein NZT92_09990 [Abditibacteriales bacterium]|nr:hypothetical protein [Abditibacteriales bacterium]MDW8366290.1 hypothetical protein [Abditibacteriales bacterium]
MVQCSKGVNVITATPYDFVWEQALGWLLCQEDVTFETEKEVGRLPLTVDAVAHCGARGWGYLREAISFDFFSYVGFCVSRFSPSPLQESVITSAAKPSPSATAITSVEDCSAALATTGLRRDLRKGQPGGLVQDVT